MNLVQRLVKIKERFQRDADRYSDQQNVADAIGDVGTIDEAITALQSEREAVVRDRHPVCAHDGCELLIKRYPQITEAHTGTPREGHFRPDYVAAPTGDTVQVPREPTQVMCQAGQEKAREWPKFPLRISAIYRAMLAAAPSAQKGEEAQSGSADASGTR